MEPYPPRSYFKTGLSRPYGKPTVDCKDTTPERIDEYSVLCIMSKLRSLVREIYLVPQTVPVNERMEMIIVMTDGVDPIVLQKDAYDRLYSQVQKSLSASSKECLLFEPNDGLTGVPVWYQTWVLPTVMTPGIIDTLKITKNKATGVLGLYADLSMFANFYKVYEETVMLINTQIMDMYRQGYIVCNEETMNKLQLDHVRTVPENNDLFLCAPDWDFASLYGNKISPVVKLMTMSHI